MPRMPRQKSCEAMYHIICRSFSEVLLFRENDDKDKYLKILKTYTKKYKCSVYGYCLMDNHLHIFLDPKGYDISSLMHGVNTSYVIYYNKKYKRYGHLLQERFHSRIVDSERYSLVLSAYIHNNAKDIEGYRGREEEYPYSSYGIYLGIRKDTYKLIDTGFIQRLFGIKNRRSFAKRYKEFVSRRVDMEKVDEDDPCDDIGFTENVNNGERKVIAREMKPARVIEYIAARLKKPVSNILNKSQKQREYRAFTAYVLRVLCGMKYNQICENLLKITVSGCSNLCSKGYELVESHSSLYAAIFNELICCNLY